MSRYSKSPSSNGSGSSSDEEAPPVIPAPPPEPNFRGYRYGQHREAFPEAETFDYQLREATGSRGVWDQRSQSYGYQLPGTTQRVNIHPTEDLPSQPGIVVSSGISAKGVKDGDYRAYRMKPTTSYANLRNDAGQDVRVPMPPQDHVFYPRPRPVFPLTTGIGRTNQPTMQPVPEEFRYGIRAREDGSPGQWSRPNTRFSPAGVPRPKPNLRGTPMSEIPTTPSIRKGPWDRSYAKMDTRGQDYRRSPTAAKKTMPPVRLMPDIPEEPPIQDPRNHMDFGDPYIWPEQEPTERQRPWSERSRRVAEIDYSHDDLTRNGTRAYRGRERTDFRPVRYSSEPRAEQAEEAFEDTAPVADWRQVARDSIVAHEQERKKKEEEKKRVPDSFKGIFRP